MSWLSEWRALSDQIEGFLEAGRFYRDFLTVNSSDPYSVAKNDLIPRISQISSQLRDYRAAYQSILPGDRRDGPRGGLR